MAQFDNTTMSSGTTLNDVPVNLLESFLPGFSVIRRFIIAWVGFDITIFVSACFLAAAALGGGAYAWRYLSRWLGYYLRCSIIIESNDQLYEKSMNWISRQIVTQSSRSLTAKTRKNQDELDTFFAESNHTAGAMFNFADFDAAVPPEYAPAAGRHYFYHNGRYFEFYREQRSVENAAYNPYAQRFEQKETITLSCLGRSTAPLKELLSEIKRTYQASKRLMTTISHPAPNGRGYWQTATRRPSRPMSTIYLDEAVKADLIEDAREFLHPSAPRFYARRGIPYRRGYLFHGLPGTGKTSLSLALAGIFGLEMYVLSLVEPTMSDQRLMQMFSSLPARCIVLLEDIDAAGLTRKKEEEAKEDSSKKDDTEKTEKELAEAKQELEDAKKKMRRQRAAPGGASDGQGTVTLSGLLNALDGVASQEGRILVMTTNDPEALDKALIRPGRVDAQVYFGNVSRENARLIFERMYSLDSDDRVEELDHPKNTNTTEKLHEKGSSELQSMAAEFANSIPSMKFTPAEVQGFLLTRRKSAKMALADVAQWRDETLEAKARGVNIAASRADAQSGGGAREQNGHAVEPAPQP